MPTEQISYNEIEMREISGLLELGGGAGGQTGRRALEIASISLSPSLDRPTATDGVAHWRGRAAGHGYCLQRKLIEGIDKLAKNITTAAPPQRGKGEARGAEIDLIDDSSNAVGKSAVS